MRKKSEITNVFFIYSSYTLSASRFVATTLLEGLVKQAQYQYLLTFPFYYRSAIVGSHIPTDYHQGHAPVLDENYYKNVSR